MIEYTLVDVFTRAAYAGNPLAIFEHADALDTRQMQRIANQLNLSECAFVTCAQPRPTNGAVGDTVRIFTPTTELPFAGHPLIGTAAWLRGRLTERSDAAGDPFTLQVAAGGVACRAHWDGQAGRAELRAPRLPVPSAPRIDSATAARCLGVPLAALHGEVECWDAGVPFHIVRLADGEALNTLAVPRLPDGINLLVCSTPGPCMAVRVFPQAAGVAEDSATGSAAVALAGWMAVRNGDIDSVRIAQGQAMGRPAELALTLQRHGADLSAVFLAGDVVLSGTGRLAQLPPTD